MNNFSWLGVDTGGTFTDFVYFDGSAIAIHKVLSTPHAPEQAILQGIRDLGIDTQGLKLVHGSTVATNAVLEGKGVKTVYITNQGFADVIHIGRQARKALYELQPEARQSLVEKQNCLEVNTRLSAQGELLQELAEEDLQLLRQKLAQINPDAVAINLLFSFLDDQQEKLIENIVPENIFVSRSSEVLPEYKEYERGMTTCLNAYVGPLMQNYLQRLEQGAKGATVSVMQSAGGTISAQRAGRHAVHLLLSGPAGGLKGAQFVAGLSKQQQLLTFDMGGTSTDVALIDGDITLTAEGHIGDYPVAVPMVDMHTIGAGGGSIAQVDAGGILLVGPESAGAAPGPACYGKGGQWATVTDANLVLGRLQADAFLGGEMRLDELAAGKVIQSIAEQLKLSIEQAAEGIIQVANEHMARALRVMSVQRGVDPREFTLVSFGGAGGLHVCALADALEMTTAMVPMHAGVLSALGMLVASPSREMSRTFSQLIAECDPQILLQAFRELKNKALLDMQNEIIDQQVVSNYSVDCRYRGQSFTLNLPWSDLSTLEQQFHQLHKQRYGHALDINVELVTIRVAVHVPAPELKINSVKPLESQSSVQLKSVRLYGYQQSVPVFQRELLDQYQQFEGPALIVEKVSTTYVAENWQCHVDDWGNLILKRT